MFVPNYFIILFTTEMIDSGKITLEDNHKRKIKLCVFLVIIASTATLFFPVAVFFTGMHPMEPTHVLIFEWFEFHFAPELNFLPWMILFFQTVFGVGSTITLMMISIAFCWILPTIVVDTLSPADELNAGRYRARCDLVTKNMGNMKDSKIIDLYRAQQIINVLLNEFYTSYLISFHHAGILAAVTSLIFFAIAYNNVLSEVGLFAYILVLGLVVAASAIVFFECSFCGDLVDITDGFRNAGKKIVGRWTMYGKFCNSCRVFYMQLAWPFFHLNKETFFEWCDQVLNYVVTFLIW